MQFAATAEELANSSSPSIAYRTRTELLGESRSSAAMRSLRGAILDAPDIQRLLKAQSQNGWIGQSFHGFGSMESSIRLLCERGLDHGDPVVSLALSALEGAADRLYLGIGDPGKILEDSGHGGSFTIRASLFAQAGRGDHTLVRALIPSALEACSAAARAESLSDFTEPYRGKITFSRRIPWPSIYHLRLLAFSRGWRTPDAQGVVSNAVRALVSLSPLPAIYVRHGARLIAPASFGMRNFNPDMRALSPQEWFMWFQRIELLARIGSIHSIPEIRAQVEFLSGILAQHGGRFTLPLAHEYFRKWGSYTGLTLVRDWRDPHRRQDDLTFRSLLILHYFEDQAA